MIVYETSDDWDWLFGGGKKFTPLSSPTQFKIQTQIFFLWLLFNTNMIVLFFFYFYFKVFSSFY